MADGAPDRRPVRRIVTVLAAVLLLAGGALLVTHPETPLPPEWNPAAPLRIADPVTPLTRVKLWRALSDGGRCLAALDETGATATAMPDLVAESGCGIVDRVSLAGVGAARLRPVETRCAVALRLTYWHRHGLVPAAEAAFGEGIARIEHLSSYNCRAIRTPGGGSGRMSLHATAEAIDIAGVVLDSGRRVSLIDDWTGAPDAAAFLRAARDSACDWFATTLGPDYNALHADHFHLQSRGWGACR